jgi:glycosyltransferase involved in cell wall biosynthesis
MPSSLPKISIVTPSYNQACFIEEMMLSVLNQNYPNLEYWVFDGGSTDGTLEILGKYEGHLNWVSRKDRGRLVLTRHLALSGLPQPAGQNIFLLYLFQADRVGHPVVIFARD